MLSQWSGEGAWQVTNKPQRRNFSIGGTRATLLAGHTAVKQHMPDVALGPHMQLRVVPSLEVCVAVGVNVPLQLYYLAMNHELSLRPCSLCSEG